MSLRRAPGPLAIAGLLALAIALVPCRRDIAVPPGASVDDRTVDRIAGVVRAPVVRTRTSWGAVVATGDAAVWVWSSEALAPGERIAVTGRLRRPRGPIAIAEPDRARAMAARGADLEVTARSVERLADDPGAVARVWRWAAATQEMWSARIDAAGGDAIARAALRGITVGDRVDVPPELDARWRALGIYHVLSVSGLHLAVIAGLAFAVLRRLIAASPWGSRVHPARWAALPALAAAVAYTLVTGAQLATLRALVVVGVVIAAAALDRPVRLLDAIGVAAIAILLARPHDLFDPSFQLSFTAALVLAVVPRGERRGVVVWVVRAVVTSAWITLATAPISALHFQHVAPGGVVGNVLLTPVLELLALPLALAGTVLDWQAPIALAVVLVEYVDAAAGVLDAAMPVGTVALVGGGTMLALVAAALWLASRRRRSWFDGIAWLVICAGWLFGREPPPAGELRVTFVDVGQGDAAIIELPDGSVWLVDAGGAPGARDLAAASAPGRTIARTLAAYGHDRIDLAIISHPHPDHFLGLLALSVPVGELWSVGSVEPEPAAQPPAPSAIPSFDAVAAALGSRGTRLVHPPLRVARRQAGVELVVWAPRYQATDGAAPVQAADPVRSLNDNSLVVEVRFAGRTLVFTGDLESEGEAALVAAGLGRADVVKVAHHGSPTSSTQALVDATRPALAVISCARANAYGFPSAAVLARWHAAGAEVARTDLDGSVTVVITPGGGLRVDRFAGEIARW